MRRNLQRKRLNLVKIGHKEKRVVNQQLQIANEIVVYAKQFSKPVVVMELNGIRENGSAKLNRRLHTWSFQKLQH
ncbi:hypothetical protein B6U96_11030 [Archaeoglobales archaeon ex4484_92]|nr:MAG: hypothetical protein B6U96_11030 [Archaeoglobales archaeon ex4484_92]